MMSVTASIEKDVKNSNPMVKPYLFLKSTIYILATILSGRNRTVATYKEIQHCLNLKQGIDL